MTSTIAKTYKKRSQFSEIVRRFKKNKLAIIGLFMFTIIVLTVIFANFIIPEEKVFIQTIADRFQAPSSKYLFGTDNLGRDLAARLLYGSRYSLSIGLSVTFLSLLIGALLGAIAAFFGGMIDTVICRTVDILMCIPYMITCIVIIAALGPSIVNVIIAMVIGNFTVHVKIIRSQILAIRNVEYIEAAKTSGCSSMRIIWKHVLPNVIGPLIIQASMSAGGTITSAAALSFLGIGVRDPLPELGQIIALGRTSMRNAPHLILIPSLYLFIIILSINFFGNGVRDALDPKQQKGV
jgi:peptide/nickel transport system permease protein